MNWIAFSAVTAHFALISGGGFAVTKLLRRFNLARTYSLEDAAMFCAANAFIGESIAYFASFGGNNLFYALISLVCLSSCLIPLALWFRYEALLSRGVTSVATRILASPVAMMSASALLFGGGMLAGVMNSGSVQVAATSVALNIIVLSGSFLLLMKLTPSHATA